MSKASARLPSITSTPDEPVRPEAEPGRTLTKPAPKAYTFFAQARAVDLQGPADWSERVDAYLYERDSH